MSNEYLGSQNSWFMFEGSGVRVEILGFGVWGSGFRNRGLARPEGLQDPGGVRGLGFEHPVYSRIPVQGPGVLDRPTADGSASSQSIGPPQGRCDFLLANSRRSSCG